MSGLAALYPPNPVAPPDLTRPPAGYRLRVVVVLGCLILFLGAYLAITAGSAYLCYAAFAALAEDDSPPRRSTTTEPVYDPRSRTTTPRRVTRESPSEKKPVFWLIVGGITAGLIFLFMVKGLFKRSRRDTGPRLEVTEKDQPVLFAFIRKLCADTRAPFPRHVYLVPDVNAAVAYHESFLNLVRPAQKNLIIGLGLVNHLNLTEFKAVLAHEFGHFSQKSMKLGRYVYTANRVIADVVYGRDWLDDAVAAATRTDLRIAVFAWGVQGVLWCLRGVLAGLFRITNFANASLSRQMEYNADLVAASVTGSDALVCALARLDLAGEAIGQAWTDLLAAADHGYVTTDLYLHQSHAADYLRTRRGDPTLGQVPPLPDDPTQTVQVFKPDDLSVPRMWATHPANHDREVNLKARYFRGPVDDRSAWVLFRSADAVRGTITKLLYENARPAPLGSARSPEDVQAYIDAEHAETTYDVSYHGLYDNRYLKPCELSELSSATAWVEYDDRARLAADHARLFGEDLKERMATHKARQEEAERLARLTQGAVELRGNDFEFRGGRYLLQDAPRLLKRVQEEIDKDFEWMHLLDRRSFFVHFTMATQLSLADQAALKERYYFHLCVQLLYAALNGQTMAVQGVLAAIGGQRQVEQNQFQHVLNTLRGARRALEDVLNDANTLQFPALTNVTAGQPLRPYLFTGTLIRNLHSDTQTLNGEWLGQFMTQLGDVLDRTRRVLFKSLGGLLVFQRELADRWAAQHTASQPGGIEATATPSPTVEPGTSATA